jgi:myb proto-oncogene protein
VVARRSRPSRADHNVLSILRSLKDYKNKWNSIARELYNRSGKRYYRNPKQCREQWMNYLDPRKLHSEWTEEEDLTLLTTVRSSGKKWSQVAKKLLNTRTENMVKNRYKSLISKELKKQPHLRQSEVETFLIRKLEGIGSSGCNVEIKVENVLPEAC